MRKKFLNILAATNMLIIIMIVLSSFSVNEMVLKNDSRSKIQQSSDLELRIKFDEVGSGQPTNLTDSSTNAFVIEQYNWTSGSGMNETSYNTSSGHSVKFINESRFLINHSELLGPSDESAYNFSITMWLYIESFENDTSNWVFRKQNAYGLRIWNTTGSSNQLKFRFEVSQAEGLNWVYSTTNLNLQQWYFLSMGFNETDIVFYIDGIFDANATYPTAKSSAGNELYIGGWLAGSTTGKTIYLDDFMYFSQPLNDSYILWLYENSPYLDQSEIPAPTTTTTPTTTTPTTTTTAAGGGGGGGGGGDGGGLLAPVTKEKIFGLFTEDEFIFGSVLVSFGTVGTLIYFRRGLIG